MSTPDEKKRVRQEITSDDRVKLLLFLNQVDSEDLGVSGKYFTVTYNSVASVNTQAYFFLFSN